jgi:hypothetical protein
MARLTLTPHLTRGFSATLDYQIRTSHPGMAHFANGAAFGATCGQCGFYGYWRQHRDRNGNVVKTSHRDGACAKFHALTNKHGPAVPPDTSACRYFERKP